MVCKFVYGLFTIFFFITNGWFVFVKSGVKIFIMKSPGYISN